MSSPSDPKPRYLTARNIQLRLPRPVNGLMSSSVQLSAEKMLTQKAREWPEIELCGDSSERRAFNEKLEHDAWDTSVWIDFALWEACRNCFRTAHVYWERAIDFGYHDHTVWIKYAHYEMRNREFINARTVWGRAVHYLPHVDLLWDHYIDMEELLRNLPTVRRLFDRRLSLNNNVHGWLSYIKFELRYMQVQRARGVFEKFVTAYPLPESFVHFAHFESKYGEIANARRVYQRALDVVGDGEDKDQLVLAINDFEDFCKDTQRARELYRFALDSVRKGQVEELYTKFQKRYEAKDHEIQDAQQKRIQYEEEVQKNPLNYGNWLAYIRLEEIVGNDKVIREVYQRAVANVPPAEDKRSGRRYIYLWIGYALFEELYAHDTSRTREVYKTCLGLIPHKKFSFAKIWLMAALFEVRLKCLDAVRQILDNAIAIAPKEKIYKMYIEIELQQGNIDRCKILYQKYIEWSPSNCYAWTKYAELEQLLGEMERARAILNLAIDQIAR